MRPSAVAELQERVACHNHQHSFWDRLPTELIIEIFVYGMVAPVPPGIRPVEMKFNLAISHVSRRLRKIAITTQSLWSQIYFREADVRHRWSRLCLERADKAPVDIHLEITLERGWRGLPSKPEFDEVLAIVMKHVSHWRTVSMIAERFCPLHMFLGDFVDAGTAPMLESLSLVYTHPLGRPLRPTAVMQQIMGGDPISLAQNMAPRLRELALVGIHLTWESFSFRNLTHLHLSHHQPAVQPTVAEFHSILETSPDLQVLKLNGGSGPFRDEPLSPDASSVDFEAIKLNSLRYLELTFFRSAARISLLMQLIRAPNLVTLRLEDWFEGNFDSVVQNLGNVLYGYTSVKHLDMRGIEGTSSRAFYALLEGMRDVETLTITCNDKPRNHSVSCLIPPPDEFGHPRIPVVMPNLIEFASTGVAPEDITTMLEARMNARKPLQKLRVNQFDKVRRFECPLLYGLICPPFRQVAPKYIEHFRQMVNELEFFYLRPGEEDPLAEDPEDRVYSSEASTGDDSSSAETD